MRTLIIIFSFVISVIARDNPFEPVLAKDVLPITSNTPKILTPLQHEQIRLPDTARSVTGIIVEYKNLDGSIEQKRVTLEKSVDWHMPIEIRHAQKEQQRLDFKELAHTEFVRFYKKSKVLRIETNNGLLRHFMIAKPYRIVLDFSRMSNFLSKRFIINSGPYRVIRIGNHKNYYRVVVELDGQYEYTLKEHKQGVDIALR